MVDVSLSEAELSMVTWNRISLQPGRDGMASRALGPKTTTGAHESPWTPVDVLAEGVGFEPTEAQKTSTVFETVPFVRSGSLPLSRLAVKFLGHDECSGALHRLIERLRQTSSAASAEERAQQFGSFIGARPRCCRYTMVQHVAVMDAEVAHARTCFGIGRCIHQAT